MLDKRPRVNLASMDARVTNVSGRFAPSQIEAIFFDLDNTLVQTRAADEKTCHEVSVPVKHVKHDSFLVYRLLKRNSWNKALAVRFYADRS